MVSLFIHVLLPPSLLLRRHARLLLLSLLYRGDYTRALVAQARLLSRCQRGCYYYRKQSCFLWVAGTDWWRLSYSRPLSIYSETAVGVDIPSSQPRRTTAAQVAVASHGRRIGPVSRPISAFVLAASSSGQPSVVPIHDTKADWSNTLAQWYACTVVEAAAACTARIADSYYASSIFTMSSYLKIPRSCLFYLLPLLHWETSIRNVRRPLT